MEQKTDVLVIGGGIAGLRAAIEASKIGAKTTLVVKEKLGKSGATVRCGRCGISAALRYSDPDDSPEEHLKDILSASLGMCDQKLARILAYEAPDRVKELDKWGGMIQKKQVLGCFHTRVRSLVPKVPILNPVIDKLKETDVEVIEEVMIYDLLIKNGECFGAVGVNKNDEVIAYLAKSVILATGGAGQLYKLNFNTNDLTGDGYAMAYRAGANLMNMEFMQFGVNTLYPPLPDQRIWGIKPKVYNVYGEEFLHKYIPKHISLDKVFEDRSWHYPFSTRDASKYLDIAIQKEILKGNGADDLSVFIDIKGVNKKDIKRFEKKYEVKITHFNPNILDEPIKVAPFHHAINGGMIINEHTESTVKGLFGCGEVITGPHGADRLGGNMMAACLVFGARAGKYAAEKSNKTSNNKFEQVIKEKEEIVSEIVKRKYSPLVCEDIKKKIQYSMWKNCSIVRTEEGLKETLHLLNYLKEVERNISVTRKNKLKDILSLRNLIETGIIVVKACLMRKESRGGHYRDDYPEIRKEFSKPIILRKE
jgi:succinate dehydrogenase/fumarate reductase flavoprotein subunit